MSAFSPPIPQPDPHPVPQPPPPPATVPVAAPPQRIAGPFAARRYRFSTGLRAGEVAPIRDDEGHVLLSYRSFTTVAGIVAGLVSAIVAAAGIAAVLFLLAEGEPTRAAAAFVLTTVFAWLITLLAPRIQVTLYDEHHPALTLSQRTIFPKAAYVVATANGTILAELRRTFLSRIGRNRWKIVQEGRVVGQATEESLLRALVRKVLGKFHRRFETNVRIDLAGTGVGWIIRRGAAPAEVDVLEVSSDALDRRLAVAIATLVLGSEP